MNIKGIKSAVVKYRHIERERKNDNAWYADIMLSVITGKVWCDVYYDVSHNTYKKYCGGVVYLSSMILLDGNKVTMKTVREYADGVVNGNKKGE